MSNPSPFTGILQQLENEALQQLTSGFEEQVFRFVDGQAATMVANDRARFPAYTADQLTHQVVGDLKHAARVHLGWAGFMADVLWDSSTFVGALTPIVAAEVSASAS